MRDAATDTATGLDLILSEWARRYVFETKGRLVGLCSGGVPPRLLFARSAEGCVWRFRVGLSREIVDGIAKLAGRERGWRSPDEAGADPPPPERLVMIARLLGGADCPAHFVRETIVENGTLRAEIWIFE